LSHEEVSYFGEMAGRIAEKRTIVVVTDALAVGSSRAEAATSGIWKKKKMLPLLLPPRDGALSVPDGNGDDNNDGIVRSEGGIVASVIVCRQRR